MINDSDYEELRTRLVQDFNSYFAPSTAMDTISSLAGWKSKVMGDGSFGRIFNGPQWLDGVAIRDGVISTAKLKATMVVSNTFTTSDTANADRVEFTSAGIKTYGTISGTPNIVTAWLKTDGTGFVGSTDGTATTAALAWTNAAATGSMRNTITIGSGGKLAFGGSGADYLDNNILHFEVSNVEEAVIEIKNGSYTPHGQFSGIVSSTDAGAYMKAFASTYRGGTIFTYAAAASGTATLSSGYDATHYGQVTSQSLSTYSSIDATVINGTTGTTGWSTTGHDTASSSYSQCQINGSAKLQIYAAGTYINNNLYPGGQSTRYIYDTGSYTGVSGGLAAGGAFYPTAQTAIYFDKNAGTGNARIKGANLELPDGHLQQVNFGAASGALPAATKYMPVFDLTAGALRYIPCYTSPGPWTA